jgi:hypothetical protein
MHELMKYALSYIIFTYNKNLWKKKHIKSIRTKSK